MQPRLYYLSCIFLCKSHHINRLGRAAHLWCAVLFVLFKSDPFDCGASNHQWVTGSSSSSSKGTLPGQGYKKATIPPQNPHATFPSLAYMCAPTGHHQTVFFRSVRVFRPRPNIREHKLTYNLQLTQINYQSATILVKNNLDKLVKKQCRIYNINDYKIL